MLDRDRLAEGDGACVNRTGGSTVRALVARGDACCACGG
jgi:hypothetical protein